MLSYIVHIRQRDASASAVRVLSGPTESPAEHSVRKVKCYMLKAFCWATIRRRKRMKGKQIAVQNWERMFTADRGKNIG